MTAVNGATPLQAYERLREDGVVEPDPIQLSAIEKLDALHGALAGYAPRRDGGWRERLRLRKRRPPPQGLYLYGGVGRGKTMVMDLFFETVDVGRKRRAHFHGFMLDVHDRIHSFRKTPPDRRDGDDPIPPVARDLAADAWLLCFDEFEVRDVADAMILGRLFTQLFELGVIVVATSNREPDDLYKGGLNRQLFLPFIALMKQQLDILHLDGGTDYRLARLAGHPVYHSPLDDAAARELDLAFENLTDNAVGTPDVVEVKGRQLHIRQQAHGVARFTFEELCARPLGPIDYLALAERYHTLIVADIPVLGPERRNEARRLVMLIDVLYDNHNRLICSAAAAPDALYLKGDGTFEFARTASRLIEMQSSEYLAAPR